MNHSQKSTKGVLLCQSMSFLVLTHRRESVLKYFEEEHELVNTIVKDNRTSWLHQANTILTFVDAK